MRALAVALAFAAASVHAGAVFKSSTTTVRLGEKPCEGIPAQLLGEDARAFREAVVIFRGRTIAACWTLQDDRVLLVDAESDSGAIPAVEFKFDGT